MSRTYPTFREIQRLDGPDRDAIRLERQTADVARFRADREDVLTRAFVALHDATEHGVIESFAVGPGGTFQVYFLGPDGVGRGGTIVLDADAVLEFTERFDPADV